MQLPDRMARANEMHRFLVETADGEVFLIEEIWETIYDRFGIQEPYIFKHGSFRILSTETLDILGTATQDSDDEAVFHLSLPHQNRAEKAYRQ